MDRSNYLPGTSYYDFLIGNHYGRLTVKENIGRRDKNDRTRYLCDCDCGAKDLEIVGRQIFTGNTRSCGCLHRDITSECMSSDLTGLTFKYLKVLEPTNKRANGKIVWKCECDCGNICYVPTTYLTMGDTISCGCKRWESNIKHGECDTELYKILSYIKGRCYNINNTAYQYYGAKGVTVCNEWMDPENGFMNFKTWAYEHNYIQDIGLTLDRINPFGNYEPSNCRWITLQEQQWNKRNTIRLADGISFPQFCHEFGLDYNTLYHENPDLTDITAPELYDRYFWSDWPGIDFKII